MLSEIAVVWLVTMCRISNDRVFEVLEMQSNLMETPRLRRAFDQAKSTCFIPRDGQRQFSPTQGFVGGDGFFWSAVVTRR